MSKICNNCGNAVDDSVNFCPACKSQSFRQKQEITTPNNTVTHKLLYWEYDGHYVLSKSKVTSIAVFLMFSLIAIPSGAPGGILFFAFIFAALTYVLGFAIHKIIGRPLSAKITHNDYGLASDLAHLLFFWQNNEGEYVLSKTKIISSLIFILFFAVGLTSPAGSLFVGVLVGIIFGIPAFLVGFGVHKLTNPNPQAKVKKVEPKKETKKVEAPKKPKVETKKPISPYIDYQIQLDELNTKFNIKEKSARNIIEKRFQPPQITYTRFINGVEKSAQLFKKNSDSAYTMIELADEYSPRIAEEIESKIDILKSIINKMDKLSNELILNEDETEKDDVENLITEMDDLIKSVKDYE